MARLVPLPLPPLLLLLLVPLAMAVPLTNLNCECGHANRPESRIVGGSDTQPNEYPWMAALVQTGEDVPFCGGSLINDRYVLTAAQCVNEKTTDDIEVIFGKHSRTENSGQDVRMRVQQIIIHWGYTHYHVTTNGREYDTYAHDVALLKLEDPLSLPYDKNLIGTICLAPAERMYLNAPVVAVGWGSTQEGEYLPDVLQHTATMYTMKNDQCDNWMNQLTDDMICAANEDTVKAGIDACHGDEGGPLMVTRVNNNRTTMVGIRSWGIGCGLYRKPGVYMRVSRYRQWIAANTGDAVYCMGW